ncbi:DUF262 domain-containing protein [Sphingobacterium multivorum]|nr:DUF262 domain-containing protein [Sphingobacterium multivorum]QQT33065.1 DUF262 domain-containing protein [Sphingobacterium multivorum]
MPDFRRTDLEKLSYSPIDVDIRQQAIPVENIVDMIKSGAIELWRQDDFQRLQGLWSLKEKSRLIESILMNIPLPIFYLDGSRKPWKIIDGLQRLTVLHEFINNRSFALRDLQYQSEIEGLIYDDLPFFYQRMIRTFVIQAYIINPGTPEEVKFNIFQRINTFGIRLNAMEIRNGYYSGIPSTYILELTRLPAFQYTIGRHIASKRMKDREFVLRFIALFLFTDLYSPPMDVFLDRAMYDIGTLGDVLRQEIKDLFNRSLETCIELFGENAFFSINNHGSRMSSKPNIALFDTWMVNLAKKNEDTHRNLVMNKDFIWAKFAEYLQLKEFRQAISPNASSYRSVDLRLSMISDLIENIEGDDQ